MRSRSPPDDRADVLAARVKHFKHPAVGELHLNFNRLDLAADPGLTLFTHVAEAGSRDEDALKLLGGWALIVDTAESARMADQSWSPNATRGSA